MIASMDRLEQARASISAKDYSEALELLTDECRVAKVNGTRNVWLRLRPQLRTFASSLPGTRISTRDRSRLSSRSSRRRKRLSRSTFLNTSVIAGRSTRGLLTWGLLYG